MTKDFNFFLRKKTDYIIFVRWPKGQYRLNYYYNSRVKMFVWDGYTHYTAVKRIFENV